MSDIGLVPVTGNDSSLGLFDLLGHLFVPGLELEIQRVALRKAQSRFRFFLFREMDQAEIAPGFSIFRIQPQ